MDKMILGRVGILIILFIYLSPYLKSSTSIFTHQSKAEAANVKKIVAIGDIHGAYPEFVSILQEMGLIDQQLNWSGGNTHLVQTGDSIDRGTRDKDVLDLLMKLEKQAEKAGGRVLQTDSSLPDKPAGDGAADWQAFLDRVTETPLYFELTIDA